MKTARLVLILLSLLLTVACSRDVNLAKVQIDNFHAQFNAGDFSGIYASASDTLKEEMTEAEFAAKLRQMKLEHGRFVSTELVSWHSTPEDHWATVNYASTYERGNPAEQFVYRTENDVAKLYGYFVNARALIICRTGMTGARIGPPIVPKPRPMIEILAGLLVAALGLYCLVVGSVNLDNGGSLSGWKARIPAFGIMVGGGLFIVDPMKGGLVFIGSILLAGLILRLSEP